MKIILLVLLTLSIAQADFISNGNIVIDSNSKLQWQDDRYIPEKKNWEEAIDYCESISLGGYTDWRLPNINELLSIMEFKRRYRAYPDYWTSTTSLRYASYALYIDFNNYNLDEYRKTNSRYIRCVRGGE